MYFDRFDILEAYYCFFMDYHKGQNSKKYARLCRIKKYFKPNANIGIVYMSENALAIYENLVEKEEGKK